MKINILTAAAVAVAGLAVVAFARNSAAKASANTSSTVAAAQQFFGLASAQRQASGAAVAQNTDYLREWSSPMADTLFSNGSLGD